MTRTFRAAFLLLIASAANLVASPSVRVVENTWDYSVQVSSVVELSPAKVTLSWPQDTNALPSSYTVFRRMAGAAHWGSGTTLSGGSTTYVDSDVVVGNAYEYRLVKVTGSYTGYGYITTGVHAPLVDQRGKIVLIVDNTVAPALATEFGRLEQDLVGDGWTVIRRDVGRNDSVRSVKAAIKSVYDSDPRQVKSVFLFGHVPVPYSGQLNPDGHPDHIGAWPADAFYGDMNGLWTDTLVNYKQTLNSDPADAARISNIPGDGKFDQTTLPSTVELEVGRVDLANMPGRASWDGPSTFPSELELLRNYLKKDHDFRHRKVNPPRRAVLGDYFGQRGGEAFAASGFRNFAPLVGPANVRNLNQEFGSEMGVWIPHLAQHDYLLSYGCGAGNYATIAGLGNTGLYNDGSTTELVSNDVRGVFNLLFGSWLGDWDHEDNILRAPLATSSGLVSVWSGRPHWFIHPLGVGATIGYVTRLTMNNTGDYQTQINSAQNRIHIALMGDPTLRLHPVLPAENLHGALSGNAVLLSWSPSSDSALIGYHAYRAPSAHGPFTRLTRTPIMGTNFTDLQGSAGATYMIRAIKLEETPSGTYENAAQGTFWSAADAGDTQLPIALADRSPLAAPRSPADAPSALPFSPDAPVAVGSARPAALTIASSSSSTSADETVAPGGTSPAGRDARNSNAPDAQLKTQPNEN